MNLDTHEDRHRPAQANEDEAMFKGVRVYVGRTLTMRGMLMIICIQSVRIYTPSTYVFLFPLPRFRSNSMNAGDANSRYCIAYIFYEISVTHLLFSTVGMRSYRTDLS